MRRAGVLLGTVERAQLRRMDAREVDRRLEQDELTIEAAVLLLAVHAAAARARS